MTIPSQTLREIADGTAGVTPGPWHASEHPDGADLGGYTVRRIHSDINGTPYLRVWRVAECWGGDEHEPQDNGANAAHLARLDPATVRDMATELLDRREGEEWRDIATNPPPKNGEHFLATWGHSVVIARWGTGSYNRRTKTYDSGWCVGLARNAPITAWRPLPAPPIPAPPTTDKTE